MPKTELLETTRTSFAGSRWVSEESFASIPSIEYLFIPLTHIHLLEF